MSSQIAQGTLVAGKYRVEHLLGEGGMGLVVSAVHEHLHQRVAVKLMRVEAMADDEAVERFLREARASVKLKSEHVGQIFDVGALEDGTPYMVMEYLEGRDLHAELSAQGRLAPSVAVDFILQTCHALADAHSHGIVHRDVKPANLFLTRDGTGAPLIKVLDFGISKAATTEPELELTATQAVLGSPGYMSPEQLRSSRRVDARSDIWAVGVVLYQLLSGELPFRGESFSHMCIKIATEMPMPIEVPLPPGLEAVVLRCLEKDPSKRYQSIAELAFHLDPFSDGSRGTHASISRLLGTPESAYSAAPPPAPLLRTLQETAQGAARTTVQTTASHRKSWLALLAVVVAIAAAVVVGVSSQAAPEKRAGAHSDAGALPALAPDAASLEASNKTEATSTLNDAAPIDAVTSVTVTIDAGNETISKRKRTKRKPRKQERSEKTEPKKKTEIDLDLRK